MSFSFANPELKLASKVSNRNFPIPNQMNSMLDMADYFLEEYDHFIEAKRELKMTMVSVSPICSPHLGKKLEDEQGAPFGIESERLPTAMQKIIQATFRAVEEDHDALRLFLNAAKREENEYVEACDAAINVAFHMRNMFQQIYCLMAGQKNQIIATKAKALGIKPTKVNKLLATMLLSEDIKEELAVQRSFLEKIKTDLSKLKDHTQAFLIEKNKLLDNLAPVEVVEEYQEVPVEEVESDDESIAKYTAHIEGVGRVFIDSDSHTGVIKRLTVAGEDKLKDTATILPDFAETKAEVKQDDPTQLPGYCVASSPHAMFRASGARLSSVITKECAADLESEEIQAQKEVVEDLSPRSDYGLGNLFGR